MGRRPCTRRCAAARLRARSAHPSPLTPTLTDPDPDPDPDPKPEPEPDPALTLTPTPTRAPAPTPSSTCAAQAREGSLGLARTLLAKSGGGAVPASVLQLAVAHGHRAMAQLLLKEPGATPPRGSPPPPRSDRPIAAAP